MLAAVALSVAFTGFSAADAQAQAWPELRASAQAADVLAAFKRGPYGQMAKGRVARETLVPGIYAIADPSGKYAPIFTDARIARMKNGSGAWLSVDSGKPLPAAQVQALRREMAAKLDVGRAVTLAYGSGGPEAILVSAYDCPYCRQLEKALDAGKADATVHVFPMSLQYNRPAPMAVARNIWCSTEPGAAWKAAVLEGKAPAPAAADCDKDARDTSMLMALFDIKAVPARIHADGRVSPFLIEDL